MCFLHSVSGSQALDVKRAELRQFLTTKIKEHTALKKHQAQLPLDIVDLLKDFPHKTIKLINSSISQSSWNEVVRGMML